MSSTTSQAGALAQPRTLSLHGRVAVVTGASRGIGLACAGTLAAAGARVVLASRDAQALAAAAQAVDEACGTARCLAVPCDVADAASVRELFQQVFKTCQRLDVLVANAGVMDDAPIGMVTPAQIERVFGTNTAGLLYCAQYASRLMARTGGGSIVALSSIVARDGAAGQSVYAGAKAAVLGIVQALARELAPAAVRVNALAPGFIDTELTRHLPEAVRERTLARIGLGRAGQAGEVADAALFLASDLSRYVTGQVIGVDGGLHL